MHFSKKPFFIVLAFLLYFQSFPIFAQNQDWDCGLYTHAINIIYQKHLIRFPSESSFIAGLNQAAKNFIDKKITEFSQENQIQKTPILPTIAHILYPDNLDQDKQTDTLQLTCDWVDRVQNDIDFGDMTKETVWLKIIDTFLKNISSLSSIELYQGQNEEKKDISEILFFNYDSSLDMLHIRLDKFSPGISEKIIQEITSHSQLKSILFNLFYNTGGDAKEEHKLMTYFLSQNSLANIITNNNGEVVNVVYKKNVSEANIPMGIIVGPYTASAAENFTEVLKQHGRAFSYGHLSNVTAGKGHSTGNFTIDNHLHIKMPLYFFYPPSGKSIERKGVLSSFSFINLAEIYKDNKDLQDIVNTKYDRVDSLPRHIPEPYPLSPNQWYQVRQQAQEMGLSEEDIQSWENSNINMDLWSKYPQEANMYNLANRFLKMNFNLMNQLRADGNYDKFSEMNQHFHTIVARQMLFISQEMCPSVNMDECDQTQMIETYNTYDRELAKTGY